MAPFSSNGIYNTGHGLAAFTDPAQPKAYPRLLKVIAVDQNGVQLGGASAATYGGVSYDVEEAFVNATASGDTQILAAPAAGSKYVVLSSTVLNNGGADITVKFRSNTTAITLDMRLGASGGGGSIRPTFTSADGEALNINLSAAGTVGAQINYITVPV